MSVSASLAVLQHGQHSPSRIVFMIWPQFKLTAPSVTQMSTELRGVSAQPYAPLCSATHSSHSRTWSNDAMGTLRMTSGTWLKSEKTKTTSNDDEVLVLSVTRSRCTISTSESVMTVNGGSVRYTRQSVVGCSRTFVRWPTPLKPSCERC